MPTIQERYTVVESHIPIIENWLTTNLDPSDFKVRDTGWKDDIERFYISILFASKQDAIALDAAMIGYYNDTG